VQAFAEAMDGNTIAIKGKCYGRVLLNGAEFAVEVT
jgi:hypothetical protein